MTQTTLFLNKAQEQKVSKFKKLWSTNKHDTIIRMVEEFEEKQAE